MRSGHRLSHANRSRIRQGWALPLLCLFLSNSQPAHSAPPARLAAKVLDKDDKPVAGVQVTITHRSQGNFRKTKTTDAKGRFYIAVQVPTLLDDCFGLLFEAPGYQSLHVWERLIPGRSLKAKYTLKEGGGATYHNQGVEALQTGDLATAEMHFRRAVEVQPSLSISHHALAEIYSQTKRHAKAIEAASAALVGQPGESRSLEILYSASRALKQDELANEALISLAASGHVAIASNHLVTEGLSLLKNGAADLALVKLRLATSLHPDLVQAHIALAEAALRANRPQEAASAAANTLAIDANNSKARQLAIKANCLLGDWSTANTLLEEMLAQDTELHDIALYRQVIDMMDPEATRSTRSLFDQLIDRDPDHARARYMLGLLAARSGDTQSARVYIARFLELAPGDSEAHAARSLMSTL